MKIAKLILLAFPIVIASALMFALPAAASIVNTPTEQVTLVSTQAISQSVTNLILSKINLVVIALVAFKLILSYCKVSYHLQAFKKL